MTRLSANGVVFDALPIEIGFDDDAFRHDIRRIVVRIVPGPVESIIPLQRAQLPGMRDRLTASELKQVPAAQGRPLPDTHSAADLMRQDSGKPEISDTLIQWIPTGLFDRPHQKDIARYQWHGAVDGEGAAVRSQGRPQGAMP